MIWTTYGSKSLQGLCKPPSNVAEETTALNSFRDPVQLRRKALLSVDALRTGFHQVQVCSVVGLSIGKYEVLTDFKTRKIVGKR